MSASCHQQVTLSLEGHDEHRLPPRAEAYLHFCTNLADAETCTPWLIALCRLFRELLVNRELELLDETLSHSAIYEWSEDEKINNNAARWIHNHFWCVCFSSLSVVSFFFLLLHISSLRGCFSDFSAVGERPSCFYLSSEMIKSSQYFSMELSYPQTTADGQILVLH